MDAILHGNTEQTKPVASVQQTKLIGQASGEVRTTKVGESSFQNAKRSESQKPTNKQLTSSNILTWDNPYTGSPLLIRKK